METKQGWQKDGKSEAFNSVFVGVLVMVHGCLVFCRCVFSVCSLEMYSGPEMKRLFMKVIIFRKQ